MDWLNKEEKSNTQGSIQWHEFRSKGIGSSDIATIMGVSPFGDIYTLWLDKTNQLPEEKKFKGNWATERGSRLEPIVREKYEKQMGLKFPDDIAIHKEFTFMRCSFDGINHDIKRVLEIKCPGKIAHQTALMGKVPDYYYPQCQWLLMVSGYNDLDYVSWDGESEDLVIVRVNADKEYQSKMIEAAKSFWDLVINKIPPDTGDIQVNDQVLTDLLDRREKLKQEIDALSISFEMINDEIKKLATQDSIICNGFNIKWVEIKGNVDYKKIPELQNINLDLYRKPSYRRMDIRKC